MPLDLTPHNERVEMLREHWQTGRVFALLVDQTCEWMEGYGELVAELTATRARIAELEAETQRLKDWGYAGLWERNKYSNLYGVEKAAHAKTEEARVDWEARCGRLRAEARQRIAELEAEAGRLAVIEQKARAYVEAKRRVLSREGVQVGFEAWSEVFDQCTAAERALLAALEGRPIPEITEDSSLDDLLAWGRAVAEAGRVTPERSRELLHIVRAALEDEEKLLTERLRIFDEVRGSVKLRPEVLAHLRKQVFGDSAESNPEEVQP